MYYLSMADPNSKSAVIKAIAGNAVITVGKGAATLASGSGAMAAETLHSLVDTLNQGLLLIGHRRSLRPATSRFPHGFGVEANFWGLLAAIGILVFGGGLTIQHGIHALAEPKVPNRVPLVLGILAFATITEAWVLWQVIVMVARSRGDKPWRRHLRDQSASTITVLLEDAAAVLGCLLAAAAVGLCVATGDGIYDAIVQLAIGGILALVGLYLIWRNRGALIGQAVAPELVVEITRFLADLDEVDRVTAVRTRQLSADTFTLMAELVFSGGGLAGPLMDDHVKSISNATDDHDRAETLGRFADRLLVEQARHVDAMEEQIAAKFPGAVYISLEPHLRDDTDL